MATTEHLSTRARTKIVATVGPACRTVAKLVELLQAGVDVFRVNMAHGTRAEHEQTVHDIRTAEKEVGRPVAILVDLSGPKIRLGKLLADPLDCVADEYFTFVRGEESPTLKELTSNYALLIDELNVGDNVMLADGTVSMRVESRTRDTVRCRVVQPGIIRSRQGINLPGAALSVPAMTEDDTSNALWAAKSGIDFVSLSFVRSPNEIHALKTVLRANGCQAHVVAKIEKREALDHLEAIVNATDAVMVARGDLGVEIDVAETPVAQKRIIAMCQKLSKPVIVATQMLDSMHHSRRPTRAEATDVANAILDGADACMLSGETAIGEFPREAVEMMTRIMIATEEMLRDAPLATDDQPVADVHPITAAVVHGAARIARQLKARMVVIATRRGGTARVKAKQRDFVRTLGVSDSEVTLRRMCLYWGIIPLPGAPVNEGPELRKFIDRWGLAGGSLQVGDRVVFITGNDFVPKAHNLLVVHEVEAGH
ncbi:MAG TPA: pyruvate kinase [Pirellulaceae bacterium]|nr:pyruvate kinase [Pirellulaceae bacterium]